MSDTTDTTAVDGTVRADAQEPTVLRVLNCRPSPRPEDDWGLGHARSAGVVVAAAEATVPPSFDLREDWWAVGDQRSTGSCVGWATADSVLRWHLVKAGRLGPDEPLSVRFQWMAAKETDQLTQRPTTFIEVEGTSVKAALDVARKFGAVRDRDLPFGSPRLYKGTAKAFYLLASQLRIGRYVNLGRDLGEWRRWIATEGPVLTRLDVDDAWIRAADTRGVLAKYQRKGPAGHAVALVGYARRSFVVRNSWGRRWGDEGFGYPSDAYAEAAFTEAYGVGL